MRTSTSSVACTHPLDIFFSLMLSADTAVLAKGCLRMTDDSYTAAVTVETYRSPQSNGLRVCVYGILNNGFYDF